MKDYKANIITALIFLLLIGSGFLAIEIRDRRAEEKVRAEEQRERKIQEEQEAKGNENREKILEKLDNYIEKLESDKEHENKIYHNESNFGAYVIEDIGYIKKIKSLLEESYVYYYDYSKDPDVKYGLEVLEVFEINDITIIYYVFGSYEINVDGKYFFNVSGGEKSEILFREIIDEGSKKNKK